MSVAGSGGDGPLARAHGGRTRPPRRARCQAAGIRGKSTAQPDVTASMRAAMENLGLETRDVVHTGDSTFPLAPGIRAVAIHRLLEDVKPLP